MVPLSYRLIEKSKEAFIVGIELYNKPTIKYRVEGFSFFICNAWELMLKAHIINTSGESEIYYKDKPDRTLSLETCIKKIFTNDKDPLRINLEKIIELRNTSTHFITQEYEMVYVPLFQACVLNFTEKMKKFHNVDITELIPQNFLTLSVSMKALDSQTIIAKYPEEIANKLINSSSNISTLIDENNDRFGIRIDHYHFITKDKNRATSQVAITKDADAHVKILRELKDPNNTHKLTMKNCIDLINKRLTSESIDIKFNRYIFLMFCDYYGLKEIEKFCFVYKIHKQNQYSYSMQVVDFIIDEIKKDPDNIVKNIKKSLIKK
ncbi:hypothetical protein Q604_UNBC07301G0026 [human gut metagenome]|uniref:Uncharacterized protein n=1 Tax=human gut metagenome TaxID=408170 RepID=W1YAC7_9ZZZZ